ncbi:MAG: hypothetical protein ACLQBJ_09760 [Bryobacteraceae bacterium]
MPRAINRAAALAALLLSLAGCDRLYHQRLVYAITGTTLIDGEVQPPIEDATVVVDDGRITAMGPASEVAIPRNADLIDGRGKFVFPSSLEQPLKPGGPADLILYTVNPTRDSDYKGKLAGRMDNGRWWSADDSPLRKAAPQRSLDRRY